MSIINTILHSPIANEMIRLGRFIRDLDDPHSEFIDPVCRFQPKAIVEHHSILDKSLQHTADKSLLALLTELVSASWSKGRKAAIHVTTDQVTVYQLVDLTAWINEALQGRDIRTWVKEWSDIGDDIYVVVGYYTILNAVVDEHFDAVGGSSTNLENAVAASAGIVVPIAHAPATLDTRSLNDRRYIASGEQVVALQCCKVHLNSPPWHELVEADVDPGNLKSHRGVHHSETYGRFLM
jgi:hypothetical protein